MIGGASSTYSPFTVSTAEDLILLGNMYVASRALHIVAQQGIADLFEDESPHSVEELARRGNLATVALSRILRVLVPFGIFVEQQEGHFSLTKVGQMLQSNHPSLIQDLLFCEDCRWNSFGQLEHTLQSGRAGFSKLYETNYFAHIARQPEFQEGFDAHMKAVSARENPVIAAALPLKKGQLCVDVGCGMGGLIRAVLDIHPHIRGGTFELPSVAQEDLEALSHTHGDRVERFTGSFFEALPFCSDAIILKRVLHDWSDEDCVTILSRCREALTQGGDVYVVESLLVGKEDPPLLRLFDLQLLTVFGGIERTTEAYAALCERAGLRIRDIITTGSGLSIMACAPDLSA